MQSRLLELQRCPECSGRLDNHDLGGQTWGMLLLLPLLRPGGSLYVWLYKHQRYVTPLVNSIRTITTLIPPVAFARIAKVLAIPFIMFCATVNALRIRQYTRMNRGEAALALMDIFGAPYAHYHSFNEVAGWYKEAGFSEVWPCNDGRRGFGVCGRLGTAADAQASKVSENSTAGANRASAAGVSA